MSKHITARYADISRGKERRGILVVGNGDPALVSTPQSFGGPLESPSANQNLLSSVPSDSKIADVKSLSKGIIKPIVRKLLGKIPFGNVHMALMFGPLVIENGVPE
jgi:hypothetical protein